MKRAVNFPFQKSSLCSKMMENCREQVSHQYDFILEKLRMDLKYRPNTPEPQCSNILLLKQRRCWTSVTMVTMPRPFIQRPAAGSN